ncbi:T9SS type A sorting domain-containing protein [Flammeovirga aprica]|uniref:T9SS type A sorting domain-containing protein n=1 Tax=Flammeovirga aprica JL-4 TaxID=694437 RepID=A0A7X9S0F3_9BACT|nr:T9SS type A sorting domain-containing protein [Flammeovirga aprica]NME72123.1 T9SS type A sorting domain-containing protein [Flammeovirga aprica JL-4]
MEDYFEDEDNDQLTYSVLTSSEEVVSVMANGKMLVILEEGLGTCEITVTAKDNFFKKTATFKLEVEEGTPASLSKLNEIGIVTYPNPFIDKVSFTNLKNAKIVVLDIQGKSIKTFNSVSKEIDLSDLPSGNYTLTVEINSLKYYSSIIKH